MKRASSQNGFLDRLWKIDPKEVGGFKGEAVEFLQFLFFTGSNFFSHHSLLRATALSFTSLLSLVPLLALTFSVLKGLGAQNKLAPLVISQMAAGSEVVVNRVITYIGNTNMSSVGAIGLVALLYTSINMLSNIEEAFNVVWGVTKTRSFYRMFTDYLSVLVSAPLLLLAATSITTTLQSQHLIGWLVQFYFVGDVFLFLLSFAPYVTVWIALFLLYMCIPNTRVHYTSALIGAMVSGTLWELAQWVYINFQVGAGRYNAIYGTLAALPILMIWIYASWIIVLFGMEIVAAHQNRKSFRRDIRGRAISQSLREVVALATLRLVGDAFHRGEPGWGEEQLAIRLSMPLLVMRETLGQLEDNGFIVHVSGRGSGCYLPARELDQVRLDEVLLSLRGHGVACRIDGEDGSMEIVAKADKAVAKALRGVTLKELVTSERGAQEPDEKIPPGVDKG